MIITEISEKGEFSEMLHVVTTNGISLNNIHEYVDNFILCHLCQKLLLPLADQSMGYHFKIYHQDGMDLTEFEEYLNEPNFKYEFIPVATVTEALEQISDDVCDSEVDLELDGEDSEQEPDELTLCVCAQYLSLTNKICTYLDTKLRESESEVKTLNLYKYLTCVKIEDIGNSAKMQLGINQVYTDDPVAFSYVLLRMMNGDLL